MKLLYYYQTKRQDVMQAFRNDKLTVARVEAEAQKFADRFGASPLFTAGFGSHFVGITFTNGNPLYHPDLWTKPTRDNPIMVPRSPERAGSKNRARAEMLYKEFHEHFPKHLTEERASELVTALGLTYSELVDNEALNYDEVAGTAYIVSTLALHFRSELEELTCSQYIIGCSPRPSGIQVVSEEEALAAIAAQKGEAANG